MEIEQLLSRWLDLQRVMAMTVIELKTEEAAYVAFLPFLGIFVVRIWKLLYLQICNS
jgi:hypothetical protein